VVFKKGVGVPGKKIGEARLDRTPIISIRTATNLKGLKQVSLLMWRSW